MIATGAAGEAGSLPSPSSLTRVHSRLPARSSAERCPLGTSAPQRGRRDLALRKLLAAHILGSPFGGAGTAAAVTERAARQRPAQSRVPPPSLIPKGGTRLGRGDRKARRKPPWHRRCHQETPGEGFLRKTVHWTIFLFSCACWRYKTVGRCPTPCQLSFEKAGQRTSPAYGAHAS